MLRVEGMETVDKTPVDEAVHRIAHNIEED